MKRLLAIIFVLLFASRAYGAMPTYVGSGTMTAVQADCTPGTPAGFVANDILLFVVEDENGTAGLVLQTANGFAEVTNSPQGAGTANTNPAQNLAVFWKRAVGSDSMPVADFNVGTTNRLTCQIHVFRGVKTSGNPWDVTAGGNDGGANDTSAVIPGATTTASNTLVVLIQGSSFNGASSTTECGAATNADLTNITERTDETNTNGLGGGHCLITGEKASAGTYGDTTLTLANTSFKGALRELCQ
jgi:hypothetical protein